MSRYGLASALALCAVLLGSPARAADPVDVRGWTVSQYNDALIAQQVSAVEAIYAAERKMFAIGPSPEAAQAFLGEMRQHVTGALAAANAVPPWHGDAALRDVLVEAYTWSLEKCDHDLAEIVDLSSKPEVRNADLARMEVLYRGLRTEGDALDRRTGEVQRAFAQRQHITLLPTAQPAEPDLGPSFTAPGVPPEGSALDGSVHVGFAVRYQNPLVEEGNRMVDAMNTFFAATQGAPAGVEAARQAALAEVLAVRAEAAAREDWQGDASLRDAVVTLGDTLSGLLTKEFGAYTALLRRSRMRPSDIAEMNASVAAGNEGVQQAIGGLNAAEAAFQDHWGLTAYQTWLAAQPKP